MWTDRKHNRVLSGMYPKIAVKAQGRATCYPPSAGENFPIVYPDAALPLITPLSLLPLTPSPKSV